MLEHLTEEEWLSFSGQVIAVDLAKDVVVCHGPDYEDVNGQIKSLGQRREDLLLMGVPEFAVEQVSGKRRVRFREKVAGKRH